MPSIMREQINTGIAAGKPTGEQVNGQGEAIHLREQRHQKGGESAERPPIAGGARFVKTERKDDKDSYVDDDQRPETVGRDIGVVAHFLSFGRRSLFTLLLSCPRRTNRNKSRDRNSKAYGRIPKRCALCSAIKKKAAIARKASRVNPVLDLSHCWMLD